MFEYFKVDKLYIALQFVLALYASGRTTGISFDIGEGVTTAAPIVEGFPITSAVKKTNFAGRAVTDEMSRYLGHYNDHFNCLDKYY